MYTIYKSISKLLLFQLVFQQVFFSLFQASANYPSFSFEIITQNTITIIYLFFLGTKKKSYIFWIVFRPKSIEQT